MKLTFAFCTYNRADRLECLVANMRAQECPVPFEILAVNNNSKDNTLAILEELAARPGAPLRFVTEIAQGIVPARNRAIEEAQGSDILVFIDDDELPRPGLIAAAYDAIVNEGAECAGGRVEVDFSELTRPAWLEDELLGFLAAVEHGEHAFWITDESTPVWTSNIAYRIDYLRRNNLRFDARYNRLGSSAGGCGGGEDVVMLRRLIALNARIRYRPDMAVDHAVEVWRLTRGYFLKLHYFAGVRKGLHELSDYSKLFFGAPLFLYAQFVRHAIKAGVMSLAGQQGALRQGMNAAHAWGLIAGYRQRINGSAND